MGDLHYHPLTHIACSATLKLICKFVANTVSYSKHVHGQLSLLKVEPGSCDTYSSSNHFEEALPVCL